MTNYKLSNIEGIKIFYREAGADDKPNFVLFHGFPSASHMFRELILQSSIKVQRLSKKIYQTLKSTLSTVATSHLKHTLSK